MKKEEVLKAIPAPLRDSLVEEFNKILRNYRESRWEPAELDGGRFAETAYSIVRGYVDANFPAKPSKPQNMVDACKSLENADAVKFPRSVRIQIPRILVALYEIRNNRGVGHVGGDVDSNKMDSEAVVSMSRWVLAELVRVFHGVTTEEAALAVDLIVERTIPVVWDTGKVKRVLRTDMKKWEQCLLLLYSTPEGVKAEKLCEWVEYANLSVFKRDVLRTLHKNRLLEYSEDTEIVAISPAGVRHVEEEISLDL